MTFLGVKLTREENKLLKDLIEKTEMTASDIVRNAIRTYHDRIVSMEALDEFRHGIIHDLKVIIREELRTALASEARARSVNHGEKIPTDESSVPDIHHYKVNLKK